MNHIEILRRAFEITRRYRALWVFGILLALTTSGGGGNGQATVSGNGGNGAFVPPGVTSPEVQAQIIGAALTIGLMIFCLIMIMIVVFTIARYLSETALIRMVDQREETGEEVGVRAGFRLGWSRGAFRIFLIDLLFGVAGFVIFMALFLLAAAPLLAWITESEPIGILGTVISIGLFMFVILAAIIVGLALSLVIQFMRRACILENLGVFESIRRGFQLVRFRLGDVVLMGVIVVAIGFGYAILTIPVAIFLVIVGVLLGGIPAVLVGTLASLFTEGAAPYIIGAIVGLPVFFMVLVVPLTFLTGLLRTYQSTTWTLTYRELIAFESLEPSQDIQE